MMPEPEAADPADTTQQPVTGLTQAEAEARYVSDQDNMIAFKRGRSRLEIVKEALLSAYTFDLLAVSIALFWLGQTASALWSITLLLVMFFFNLSLAFRSKAHLEAVMAQTRPEATVIRDSQVRPIDPNLIVPGDLAIIGPGDQVFADGRLVGDEPVTVDESWLTGKVQPVQRSPGDNLLAGSFCISGHGMYQAEVVGDERQVEAILDATYAGRLPPTPLQRVINRVLWILRFLVVIFGAYLLVRYRIYEEDPSMAVIYEDAISIIFSMAPGGILFMILMTYINGSARMTALGALVPRAEAVETLAQADVLCLGKGGTLTGAEADLEPLEQPEGSDPFSDSRLRQILGDYARSTRSRSRLVRAMEQSFDGTRRDAVEDVLFFSLVGWQGMIFDDDDLQGAFIFGRRRSLENNLSWLPPQKEPSTAATHGERARPENLLFAYTPRLDSLTTKDGRPRLPQELVPLGFLSFSEEVVAEAEATTAAFQKARVPTKVLSMYQEDNVVRTAEVAGITARDGSPPSHLSGKDLQEMQPDEYVEAVIHTTVFSRLTSEQKAEIIATLQGQGDLVAMVGDGVADLSALRQANLAVTFRESGQAPLSTADIILLDDTLSALPPVLALGQGIFNRLLDVLKLSLTHALTAVLLTFVAFFAGVSYFPYLPAQNLAVTIFTLTLPAFAFSFWLEAGRVNTESLAKYLAFFVIPAGISIAVVVLFSHVLFRDILAEGTFYARVVVTYILVGTGLMLLIFVQPPYPGLVAGDRYSGDLRPARLAIFLWFAFLICTVGEPLRSYFNLQPLVSGWHYLYVLGAVAVWAFAVRGVWRSDVLRRLVGYHLLQQDLDGR